MYADTASLSISAQDYLRAIWIIRDVTGAPASVKALASRVGVSASTASTGVRRLSAAGLVVHARYGAVDLTPRGEELAVAMVRRHRLLETFLVLHLGYTWDQVQREADALGHAVSDRFIERLDELLGKPRLDPHGDPIPSPAGLVEQVGTLPLDEADEGAIVTIDRIRDARPEFLRYLDSHGVRLGARVRVIAQPEIAGVVTLTLVGAEASATVSMASTAAHAIRVTPVCQP